MPAFGAVTALVGLGLSAYQYGKSRSDKRKADASYQKSLANRPMYQTPQSELDAAAQAKAGLNAVNPAVLAAQQQVQQQAAAAQGFAQRNASSGAQALQAGADANAQAYSAAPGLAAQQSAYQQQQQGNYYNSLHGLTEDARYKQQDQVAANSDLQNYYLGRVGAAQQDGSQALATGVQSAFQGINAYGQYRAANPSGAAQMRQAKMYGGSTYAPQLGLAGNQPMQQMQFPQPQLQAGNYQYEQPYRGMQGVSPYMRNGYFNLYGY